MDNLKTITLEEVKSTLKIDDFGNILRDIKDYEFLIKSITYTMNDEVNFIYIKVKENGKYFLYLIGIGEDEISNIPSVTWKIGEKKFKDKLKKLENKGFNYNNNNNKVLTIFDRNVKI